MKTLRTLSGAGLLACFIMLTAPVSDAQDGAKSPLNTEEAVAIDLKIISEIRNNSEILKNLQYISDVIGPRLTGSANLKKANDWTMKKFEEYGLVNSHLEAWEIPAGWERGKATLTLVDPQEGRKLTVAAYAWTPGTKGKLTGDVVIMNARTKEDLEKFKGKLKNAIVLTSPPAPVPTLPELMSTTPRDPAAKAAGPGAGGRRGGPAAKDEAKKDAPPKEEAKKDAPPKDEAKKDGPAPKEEAKKDGPPMRRGFSPEMMAFRRELSEFLRTEGVAVMLTDSAKPLGLLNMTGSWPGEDRAAASRDPLPALFITHDDYALLYRLASRKDQTTKAAVEIENKFVPGPLAVYNTVAEIKGTEKPDEFVVVGAHLDSWDLGSGSTDNGTGSSIVLECARAIAKAGIQPKRTIRFVLFTGEEEGLYGSKEYVKKHKDEMPKTSCCLVHDTGTGRVYGFAMQGQTKVKGMFDEMSPSLKELPLFFGHNMRSQGGTDHLSFEAVGVPGFACDQDMTTYNLTHHSQADTFDKALEPELIEGAQVMAVLAVRVANLPTLLPRDEVSKGGRGGFGGGRGRNKEGDKKDSDKKEGEKKDGDKKEEKKDGIIAEGKKN